MNPRLVAINGTLKGATFPLAVEETTIGRESASAVWLNHSSVSRRHCVIRRENGDFKLFDLDSYNGTFINGIPIKEQALDHADQVRVGKIELLFLIEEGEEITSGHLIQWDDSNPLTESAKQLRPEVLLRKTEQVLATSPEHERMARDLGVVLRIARRINRLRHTQELVKEILDAIFEIIPADRGAIVLGRAEDFSSVYGKHRDQSSY